MEPARISVIGWIWQRWRPRLWVAGIVAVWFCVFIRWTVRDGISRLGAVYYASPPILIALAALFTTLVLVSKVDLQACPYCRWVNRVTLLLGLVCLGQWIAVDFRSHTGSHQSARSLTFVFWNIGAFTNAERVAQQARLLDADVMAFCETYSTQAVSPEFWKQHLPDHTPVPLKSGLFLLVKGGTADVRQSGHLSHRGIYRLVSVDVRGHQFQLLIADLMSDPTWSRQAPLEELFRLMNEQSGIPTIVAGDFNTPPTSVWFDPWRATWTRAWDAVGSGYQPTWPQPVPILTLDHLWGNKQIGFLTCRHGWTSCSDHRPVIAEFVVEQSSKQTDE